MKDDRRNGPDRRPTLADALSNASRAGLEQLARELEQRVRRRIDAQMARPKEPWRRRALVVQANSPSRLGSARGAAAQVARDSAKQTTIREKVVTPTPPVERWELPPEAAVREAPPQWISVHDRATMEAALGRGAASSETSSDCEPIYATIGLDFGTSCTKIIVRFPEEPGAPAVAIPAPAHCRSGGNPYLWQTVVWARRDGEFVAWPEPNTYPLHTLKQGIMGERPTAVVAPGFGSTPITYLDAATAYLAFVIRYTRGWLLLNQPDRFRGRRPYWFTNLGLPSNNYDNGKLIAAYRAIVATSLMMAESAEHVTIESTRAFASTKEVREAAGSATAAEALGVAIFPEVAAEVAGFMKSTAGGSGLYVIVDVGAMTLDVCAFRFRQRQVEGDLYPLLEADVRHLGVEAYHWFMKDRRSHDGFADQCRQTLRSLIWKTKRERDPNAACWRPGNDLPVFLVGGGAVNPLHREAVEGLHPWLRGTLKNEGIRLTALPQPIGLTLPVPGGDFARLPVAWGLSYAPTEIGEIVPPSAIESISRANVRNYLAAFISKDDV